MKESGGLLERVSPNGVQCSVQSWGDKQRKTDFWVASACTPTGTHLCGLLSLRSLASCPRSPSCFPKSELKSSSPWLQLAASVSVKGLNGHESQNH